MLDFKVRLDLVVHLVPMEPLELQVRKEAKDPAGSQEHQVGQVRRDLPDPPDSTVSWEGLVLQEDKDFRVQLDLKGPKDFRACQVL